MDAMRQLESQQTAGSQQSINEPIQQPNSISTDNIDDILASLEATAQSRSRLVVNFAPVETLTPQQLRVLDEDAVLQKLIGSHLFVLDDSGVLSLQGLEVIPLLGLSEADINRRLMAEPSLSIFFDRRTYPQPRADWR